MIRFLSVPSSLDFTYDPTHRPASWRISSFFIPSIADSRDRPHRSFRIPQEATVSWVPRAVIFQEKEITIIFVISIKLLSFDVWKPGLYSVLNWAF